MEKEQYKIPKTWDDFIEENRICVGCLASNNLMAAGTQHGTPIENSALALIECHILIEEGYGGIVSHEEWKNRRIKKYIIVFDDDNNFHVDWCVEPKFFNHIAFHTKGQAKEFLSYRANVRLLKYYYMIKQ